MRTTIGSAMRLVLVLVMAMGFAACGGEPLDVSGAGGDGGAPAADAGGGDSLACAPIAVGATITDENGSPVVNARCERQCSSAQCVTSTGLALWCSSCAAHPPCTATLWNTDDCTQGAGGALCCNTCEVQIGGGTSEVSGCTGTTPSGGQIYCATASDACR